VPITKYCDERRLTPRQRLGLFVEVCQAVQHAHHKGIIHRDLKPSNVLIALYDGRPVPKVIDFGVAKATAGQRLTERTMFTGLGAVVGTLEYMSPEQAEMNQLDIDTRSDIYSLGVLLYELLTGTTPIEHKRVKEAALLEVLRVIREEEPPRPSTRLTTAERLPTIAAQRGLDPKRLAGLVRGELDWIVMRALEKDRNRRYEMASGLARDVERYLHDEAVQACPPSVSYRFRKFARRNKVALAVSGLVLFFLVLLGSGIGWAVRDRTAREEQLAQERAARQARVSEQLELILDEVARLERVEKWSEALVSARRAEPALATGEAPPEVQARARQAMADLELVRRIEAIRAQSGTAWGTWRDPTRDPRFNALAVQAEQDYAAAFRGAGIDVDTLAAKQAAQRITARGAVAAAVLPALDDWVAVRNKVKDQSATRRLIEVLRIADPDPWRQRVRDCLARKDWEALETLVTSPDLERQPPATISFLAAALRQQAEADISRAGGGEGELGHRGFLLEIHVLRRAQFNYPADYWINHRLGVSLTYLRSPPLVVQEGIGCLRAAVALRPHSGQANWHLGLGYEILDDHDHAIACFRKASELAPQDASIQNAFALVLARRPDADPDEAIKLATRAIELSPRQGWYWETLGVARFRAGHWREAIETLNKSEELEPGRSPNWTTFFLAIAHCHLGQPIEARHWYDRAVAWMDQTQTKDEELLRVRTWAEELLSARHGRPTTTKPQSK